MEHSAPAWVIVFPLFAAILLPFVHRVNSKLSHPLACLGIAGSWVMAIYTAWLVVESGGPVTHRFGGWPPPWGIEFRIDHLSAVMIVLITSLSLVVLVFARKALPDHLKSRQHIYYTLYVLFTLGLVGVTSTGDLFNLYVFLEVTALTGYALIAVGEKDAPFAAFRYIVLGTIAASAYLLGLAYLYGITGSLNFVDVAERLSAVGSNRTVFVALSFLIVGFAMKAALFPLHAWLPDAYAFSPSTTTAFMAAVGTKIGAYGIFRVLYTIYEIGPDGGHHHLLVTDVLSWMAAIAIIVGSIIAIAQTDLKRMLAYSSVAQIGYVILGFSLVNPAGITGAVLHMINHAVMKCCLFLVAGIIEKRVGHRDIRRFAGLGRQQPLVMAAFTIAALSMIGLPPMAGFFSKWYLVLGSIDAGKWPFIIVILVSSLLNAVYFFRIIERTYLRQPIVGRTWERLPLSMGVPLGLTAIAILVLGLGSWPLVEHVVRFVVPAGL